MARHKRKWFSRYSGMLPADRPAGWIALVTMCLVLGFVQTASAWQDANQRYEKAMADWQAVYVDALMVWTKFRTCDESEAEALQEQYLKLKAKGDELVEVTKLAASDCVLESTTPNPELMQFLAPLPKEFYDEGSYEKSMRVGRALRKHRKEDFPLIFNTLRSAYFANEFDYAGELFQEILDTPEWLNKDNEMPPELAELYRTYLPLKELWDKEQKLREMEAVKDSLPRIQFETTKGNIVVELFEDQYPEFVNNLMVFIEAKENPYFEDLSFFFSMRHQFAITGSKSETGDQLLPLGSITPETIRQSRGNFRGSFSLDLRGRGGQPVVTTACRFVQIPSPELNGSTLVLGRVLEGMDVVSKLEKTHELSETLEVEPLEAVVPDRLIKISVLRKLEGKEYKLNIERGTPENE